MVSAWLIIQVAETIFPLFGYDDSPARYVVIVLAIGFIPTLILSWAYELTSQGIKREKDVDRSESITHVKGRKLDYFIICLLTVALLMIGANWLSGRGDRWARDEASPLVESHVAAGDWEAAYALAKQISNLAPDYGGLEEIWKSTSWITTIPSEPPGATVYRRPYGSPDAEWEVLGKTPLDNIRYPFGMSVLKLELPGRPPILRMMGGEPGRGASLRVLDQRPFDVDAGFLPEIFKINATDDLPDGMVRVPGWRINDDGQTLEVQDFFIGRFEVTNAEFQKFVDAGGYDNSDYWADEFEMNGQILGWDEAIALMVDKSGRQGPSTWMGGTFPAGQANHPVAGVSWYEADAFARFANAELPTYSHWRRAIANGALPWMIPASNLDGTGTADVGSFSGIGWAGAYDLAGNVREWTSSSNDGRVILGGAWNDPPYVVLESMLDASALPPFDRSATNGFRLAVTSDDPRVANVLLAPVTINRESLDAEPVSEDIYEVFKNLFRYDNAAPLTARTEIEEMRGRWVREYVTFDAPYDDDRIGLYLYFPEFTSKPLQTVIFWGGASWLFVDSIDRFNAPPLEFLLQSGRAVAVPVLAGTFQRRNAARVPWSTIAGRDLAIHQVRDLRRVVDYLQTRADIDAEALGYYGQSWGGRLGGIVLAVEDRIKVGVLDQAGLQHLWHPETSVVNYLPHVNTPVLQFNGVYDTDFRFETSAVPFFELLGTPLEHKKHVTGPSSHFTPRPVVIGETLDWFDKYFGQAR